MVAKVNPEMFSDALLTPRPAPSDSDEVLQALHTARDLEAQGAIREAVRCLRHAADAAEKQGDDARVLVLARAAADLQNTIGPVSLATASASSPPSQPTTGDKRVSERKMRIGSVRVALAGSIEESSFVVHRLATGQPLPDGMTEAILVLTGDVEGRVEIETTLRVTDRSITRS
jgi:hypothetical protein